MQTRNPIIDDLTKVASSAMGALTGVKDEVEARVRDQIAKILDGMDIPRRDEFEAVKAMAAKAREENEAAEEAGRRAAGPAAEHGTVRACASASKLAAPFQRPGRLGRWRAGRVTKVPSVPRSPDEGAFAALAAPPASRSPAIDRPGARLDRRHQRRAGAQGRPSRSSPRAASATSCSSSARTGRRSTTSSTRSRRRRCAAGLLRDERAHGRRRLGRRRRSTRRRSRRADPGARGAALQAVAICLLNAYANPAHEQPLAELITTRFPACPSPAPRDLRASSASTSAPRRRCCPPMSSRSSTATSAASRARSRREGFTGRFSVMQSNGGRLPAAAMRRNAITALFSGPAAGVTGRLRQAGALGLRAPRHLRHGRHQHRCLPCRRRPAHRRAGDRGRRPADPHAGARHRLGRRGRRQHRLARRRRHAARRAA